MICCLSYCSSDYDMALELALHLECLGGVRDHRCFVFHPEDTQSADIAIPLRKAFGEVVIVTYPVRLTGWPDGPNQAFWTACDTMIRLKNGEPWFWMEADCVPTTANWLDAISNEYRFCGKPILGALNATFDTSGNVIGEHVTGVAVYPPDFFRTCPTLRAIITVTEQHRLAGALPPAFDTYIAPYTVRNCAITKAIRHYWKSSNFVKKNGQVTCEFKHPYGVSNVVDMSTPLIHGCKDFSLLDLVQKRLSV